MTNWNPHPQNQWWLMCKVMPAIFPSFKLERGHALIFHFKCSRLMVGYLLKQSLKLISKCPWSYPSSYTHTYSSNGGGAILIASGLDIWVNRAIVLGIQPSPMGPPTGKNWKTREWGCLVLISTCTMSWAIFFSLLYKNTMRRTRNKSKVTITCV